MPRAKLSDLNLHLFAQIENILDEDNTPDQTKLEIDKGKAISKIASQIININKLAYTAAKDVSKGIIDPANLPASLNAAEPKQIEKSND